MVGINVNDRLYKCCCGRFTATFGCQAVAIYGLVFSAFAIAGVLVVHVTTVPFDFIIFPTVLTTLGLLFVSSVQLLVGALRRSTRLLLLYMLFMAFATIGFVCLFVISAITVGVLRASEEDDEKVYLIRHKTKIQPYLVLVLSFSLLNVILNFWFFFIVWSAYRLIVDSYRSIRDASVSEK